MWYIDVYPYFPSSNFNIDLLTVRGNWPNHADHADNYTIDQATWPFGIWSWDPGLQGQVGQCLGDGNHPSMFSSGFIDPWCVDSHEMGGPYTTYHHIPCFDHDINRTKHNKIFREYVNFKRIKLKIEHLPASIDPAISRMVGSLVSTQITMFRVTLWICLAKYAFSLPVGLRNRDQIYMHNW
jgi:hypothetical protein